MNKNNKQRIIGASAGLFSVYGFKTVSIQRISNALGVSTKTIYEIFDDKESIVLEVISEGIKQDKKVTGDILSKPTNSLEKALLFLDYFCFKTKTIYPGMLEDIKKYYPNAYQLIENFIKDTEKTIYSNIILKRGIKEGFFRKDIDISILSHFLVEISLMAWSQIHFPYTKYENKNVFSEITKNFLYGISTRKGAEYLSKNFRRYHNLSTK